MLGKAPSDAEQQQPNSPPALGCIGLLIRGLMGAKPPMVMLVTSRGCGMGTLIEEGARQTALTAPSQKPPLTSPRPSQAKPAPSSPLSLQPEPSGESCTQTCPRFPPVSCNEEKQSSGRGGGSPLHDPGKRRCSVSPRSSGQDSTSPSNTDTAGPPER